MSTLIRINRFLTWPRVFLYGALLGLVMAVLFPGAALAQTPDPATLDALPILLQALSQGPAGVGLAVAAGILLLVQVVKAVGRKVHPVFDDARVIVAITIAGTLAGSIVAVLASGGSITVAVVVNAILAAATASGLFSWKQSAVKKAEDAGDAAAGAIGGKAAAVALLDAKAKGGQQ